LIRTAESPQQADDWSMTGLEVTAPGVAVLGAGTMGSAMVRSLRRAGIPVRVWDRNRAKAEPLREVGAVIAGTAAEAADGAGVVLTMLFDGAAVLEVIRQATPAAGTLWLQTSTVGLRDVEEIRRVADELGLVLVDSPVLGTRQPAEEGKLLVLASGPDEARERATPVLDAIGSRTLWVGGAGQGTRLKLVCNSWVLTLTVGVAQSMALAEGLGVDPRLFLDAIAGGGTDTPYAHLKGGAMIERNYPVAFGLAAARKDAGLIVEALRTAGIDDRLGTAVLDILSAAAERVPDPAAVDLAAAVEALRSRG
jgi:3-hydroxyisobutyrate dehydrogenase